MQAGIISFNTPNSSFIFDLLRRSIKLCAVFLAIFRPATLVEEGSFLLEAFGVGLPLDLVFSTDVLIVSSARPLGFICIIFRERVGGGGSAKDSLVVACVAGLRRSLTASLARIAGDGEEGDAG